MCNRLKYRVFDVSRKKYANDVYLTQKAKLMIYDTGSYTVEQCTGLKDKNGKLIYEGDIVKETFLGNHKRVVKWLDTKCGFNISPEEVYNDGKVSFTREKEYVIIGNIHEDKKLLTGLRQFFNKKLREVQDD